MQSKRLYNTVHSLLPSTTGLNTFSLPQLLANVHQFRTLFTQYEHHGYWKRGTPGKYQLNILTQNCMGLDTNLPLIQELLSSM